MERPNALCSHAPLAFASKPETPIYTTSQSITRLVFRSQWNINAESAREEPRLRKLLGHISVYKRTRAYAQGQTKSDQPEFSTYLQHQVPSFEEFRAALRLQLETIAQARTAAVDAKEVDEYNSDEDDEDDSDYDSYDGDDFSEEDNAAESDDSLTDVESEGQLSECTSPTFDSFGATFNKAEEDDLWAIRPLAPFLSKTTTQLADT